MIRIGAFADVHAGPDSKGLIAPTLVSTEDDADLLMIAGDLTRYGTVDEARVLAGELSAVTIPIVAVLGNHDYHDGHPSAVIDTLEDAGVIVLEGESTVVDVRGSRVGIAGVKGFGGGFAGACASAFGEPEMKAFVGHSEDIAMRLERSLRALDTDLRIALLHYAPVPDTLAGERLEIYPFLGSYLLAEAIDRSGAHLVLHGHAHSGTEFGTTAAGVPVRNVAQPVLRYPYKVYELPTDGSLVMGSLTAPLPHS